MKQNKIMMGWVLLLLVACTPRWDDHYDAGQATVTDRTMWEYIQERPEYSEFVSLVKATGTDSILQNCQNLTVWVPLNGKIPDLSNLSDSVKKQTVRNHITTLQYLTVDMQNGIRVSAFSGKKLGIFSDDGVIFRVNSCRIQKADMVCRDGVVHEIGGWIGLQKNLKEYLQQASEYSFLNNLIGDLQDSVFDETLSTPTGELDVLGRPIYDSVFLHTNMFYRNVPLDNENKVYTLCLTPDWILQEKVEQHYKSIRDYTGELPIDSDTAKLESWLVNMIAFSGSYYDFTGIKTIASARGLSWRPAYHRFGEYGEFSNGIAWQIEDLYIPRTLIWPPLAEYSGKSYALYNIYNRKPASINVSVTGLDPDVDITASPVVTADRNNGYSVVVTPLEETNTVPFDIELSWTIGETVASSGVFRQITLLPGEYDMQLSFKKTVDMDADFDVYLNGNYVNKINIADFPTTGTIYTVKKVVTIGEEYIQTPTQVSLKTLGGIGQHRSLSILSVTFKHTANNY